MHAAHCSTPLGDVSSRDLHQHEDKAQDACYHQLSLDLRETIKRHPTQKMRTCLERPQSAATAAELLQQHPAAVTQVPWPLLTFL
jgi:hypothetical protein